MLFKKLKLTVGAAVNKVLNTYRSPLDSLEYERDRIEEERVKIVGNLTLLQTSINTLENNQAATQKAINEAHNAAKEAAKKGLDDTAKKIIQRKLNLESTFTTNQEYLDGVKINFDNLKLKVKEYEIEIDNINASIKQLKAESAIADTKVKIAETTSGLGLDSYQITKDLARGREQVAEQNARADAIEQLNAEGVYDGIKGKSGIDYDISSLVSGANADSELEKIKQELSLEDEKREKLDEVMNEE